MSGNYRISEVSVYDEYANLRVVSLQAEGSQIDRLNRAASNKFPQSFINNVYIPHVGNSIYEVYIRTNLAQIREIDGNELERRRFLNRRLPARIASDNFTGGNLLPMIIMVIDFLPGDSFLDSDVEFIADILSWAPNKVFVSPIIRFDDNFDINRRVELYNQFVKKLLEAKDQISDRIRVAASIPSFYPRRHEIDVFSNYSNQNRSPDMVILDFNRERITSPLIIGKVSRVQSFFNSESNPNYFIYGFNVKPHRRGAESPDAEDFGCFLAGLNSIGNQYSMNSVSRIFIPPALNWEQLPRVFRDAHYKYTRLSDQSARNELLSWARTYGGNSEIPTGPTNNLSSVIAKFNLDKVGTEANIISNLLRTSDFREINQRLNGKDIARLLRSNL